MKKITALLGIAAILTFAACSNSAENADAAETQNTEKTELAEATAETKLSIDGMTCAHGCKGAIEKALNNKPGIAFFEIDFDSEIAYVKYNANELSEDDIIAAVGEVNNGAYSAAKLAEMEAAQTEETVDADQE